jgi:nitrogen fixation protein NifU and related proteins
MEPDLQQRIADAAAHPRHLGEMPDADAVGTAGSPGCGDMLRVWLKFREEKERGRVIDRASFQTFGCETAMAVASVAMEMLAGKTLEEARGMDGADLSAPLGALPPMKVHCAGLVEQALQQALSGAARPAEAAPMVPADPQALLQTLREQRSAPTQKIHFLQPEKLP